MAGFAHIVDQSPVEIDFSSGFEKDGIKHPSAIFSLWSTEDLATIGVLPIVDDERPSGRITGSTLELVDGEVQRHWTVASTTFAERKTAKLVALGVKRYEVEQAGLTRNGLFIRTDDRSKLLVFAARTKAKEDDTTTKRWKVADGVHVTLDAATLIAVGDAVEDFISDCFDREASLAAEIVGAANDAALNAVNINTGWPS